MDIDPGRSRRARVSPLALARTASCRSPILEDGSGKAGVRMQSSRLFSAFVAVFITAGTAAAGISGRSSDAAAQLVQLMKGQNLDAYAAEDPQVPGRFVAAMLVPDVQLLVVAAETTAPHYVRAQLAQGNYREVYLTLHSSAVPQTKLFFQDMGCNGLSDQNGGIDIMYEKASTQTVFDGDWKAQKLSKSAYEEKLQDAERKYADALSALTRAVQDGPSDGSGAVVGSTRTSRAPGL